jgi:hypothetical protein
VVAAVAVISGTSAATAQLHTSLSHPEHSALIKADQLLISNAACHKQFA